MGWTTPARARLARRLACTLAIALATMACSTPPPPPPPPPPRPEAPPPPPTEEQLVMDDTLEVCARLAEEHVTKWTKMMKYKSSTWRDLAERADDAITNAAARCKMGRLIEKYRSQSRKCTLDMVTEYLAYCPEDKL